MDNYSKREITKKSIDYDRWYTDVILKSELADYSPVKGCMVIRPYGYAIWENIQKTFDDMIKKAGVENAYFPLFIPYSFLQKEKEHVEGFSPQLAVVTHGGGEKLAEPLVVRPTSETVMYDMYSKWISSWRDLPVLINQWNNVVRWEKRTFLFLRTSEFLWQEGHTAHETESEALEFTLKALEWYKKIYSDYLAVYPMVGKKSESEKFAGGVSTYATELLMPDGLALQGATSHLLGQNFSKVFGIKFQNRNGENEYAYQTSWGLSTRSIGGLIMAHGDDQGLVLPPMIAPIQVVIIPVKNDGKQTKYVRELSEQLIKQNIRVKVDDRDTKTPGWKFNEWELKGVPIRVEVGEREVASHTLTVVKRIDGIKNNMNIKAFIKQIHKNLTDIQQKMYQKSYDFTLDNTTKIDIYEQFKKQIQNKKGVVASIWCGDFQCETQIKKETKATTRVLPLNSKKEIGNCIYCGKEASSRWLFAQSY
jgi:prolyl-tRNA synthetase